MDLGKWFETTLFLLEAAFIIVAGVVCGAAYMLFIMALALRWPLVVLALAYFIFKAAA